jgi:hypothetical protein
MAYLPTPSTEAGATSNLTLAALTGALRDEARLLAELTGVVHNQRAGVAADDVQTVDESVFGAHRILRTIGEARRRRRGLLDALVGSEDLAIHELDEALGILMTPELRQARDELQAAANLLSREIAINRRIIQDALRAGDEQMRTLCGAPQKQVSYGADARAVDDTGQSGLLLNRQV